MKRPCKIVPDTSLASSGELADWLAKDGQLLVPLVELLDKGERAIDGCAAREVAVRLIIGNGSVLTWRGPALA